MKVISVLKAITNIVVFQLCTYHKIYSVNRDTYIERKPGETANDRNDRAIRTAAQWYKKHLELNQDQNTEDKVQLVLLTNDRENANKAKDAGITTYTGK